MVRYKSLQVVHWILLKVCYSQKMLWGKYLTKHQFLYLHAQYISVSTLREALTILKAIYNQATPYVRSDWLKAGSSVSSLVTPFPLNLLHLYFVNFCAFVELHCKSCIDLKSAAIPARQRTPLSLNRWGLHQQTGL